MTAKAFRTWSATLLATGELRALQLADSQSAVKRQVNAMLKTVATHLGNTPAICRKSYIDPRVIESYVLGKLERCATRTTRRLDSPNGNASWSRSWKPRAWRNARRPSPGERRSASQKNDADEALELRRHRLFWFEQLRAR